MLNISFILIQTSELLFRYKIIIVVIFKLKSYIRPSKGTNGHNRYW